jgi:DNA-binding response OmpR family regulator
MRYQFESVDLRERRERDEKVAALAGLATVPTVAHVAGIHQVEVDTARQRVWVGGAEVICQPRVYQLLVMLCEAGGAVVTREEIFARLWKGQAIASDESLTQVAHRLRAVLGPASAAVRTVRGTGFRLDALGRRRRCIFGSIPLPPRAALRCRLGARSPAGATGIAAVVTAEGNHA